MRITVSPSEAGIICQALQKESYRMPLYSQERDDITTLMCWICDEVKEYYRATSGQFSEEFYNRWAEDNNMIAPY